ncbi:triokinase/FMN cyclase-like [Cimex lectularius]|uniref:Triokinase/FMN cyclase n=1 Tax=Cimex lectularius TaxID=79782 RepID=A0A8I6TC82_CIMLE|nr:triokinase/FMN cyclase-like [Cimex lectularius]
MSETGNEEQTEYGMSDSSEFLSEDELPEVDEPSEAELAEMLKHELSKPDELDAPSSEYFAPSAIESEDEAGPIVLEEASSSEDEAKPPDVRSPSQTSVEKKVEEVQEKEEVQMEEEPEEVYEQPSVKSEITAESAGSIRSKSIDVIPDEPRSRIASAEIGRIYPSQVEEEEVYIDEYDVNKPSGDQKLDKFISSLTEVDVSSLKVIRPESEESYRSEMPKSLHQLFSTEKPPDEDDEFAWPNYMLTDRDQIYENLITKTICNSKIMVIEGEHILMRRDHMEMGSKVRILGGGMAGLDPLFGGYVGKGMLTAAVIGDRYEAPKVSAIDKAIEEMTIDNNNGILIIVQNSYENRVAFGLAMQRARQRGILIDMITVSDDCFEDKRPGGAGRPGLTGILLVLKIAGAMSEKGKQIKEIFITCRTILMATISCHILPDQVRIGTSTNADEGARIAIRDVQLKDIITWMIQYATHPCRYFSLPLSPLNKIVLLVNSYTQDSMFLYSATAEIIRQVNKLDVDIERVFAGNYITSSRGERGFTITIFKVHNDELLEWIDAPVDVEAWHGKECGQVPSIMKSITMISKPIEPFGPSFPPDIETKLPHILNYVCRAILAVETLLNTYDLNRYVGSAIARGASALGQINKTNKVDCRSAYSFLKQISVTLEENMNGAIGALYGLVFQGAAEAFLCFSRFVDMEPWMWGMALEGGVKNLICFGKLKEGDCTLLDALVPPLRKYNKLVSSESEVVLDGVPLMIELLNEAKLGMNSTRKMRSQNHIPGEPEVGAYTVTIVFSAILEAIR